MEINNTETGGNLDGDEVIEPSEIGPTPEDKPINLILPFEDTVESVDDEKRHPAWMVVIISVWVLGIYIAFYYFLITHRTVSYILEG
jgi:hypothetical protein